MNNISTYGLLILTVVIIALVFVFELPPGDVQINYELTQENYMAILTTFLFAALLAERLVEVLIGATRKPGKRERLDEIERLEAEDPVNTEELKAAKRSLHEYRGETEIKAMYISFIIGILVALAGFRVLEALLDPDTTNLLFDVVDTLLSAGLIAGGSKGINAVTATMQAFFERVKDQQRAST